MEPWNHGRGGRKPVGLAPDARPDTTNIHRLSFVVSSVGTGGPELTEKHT